MSEHRWARTWWDEREITREENARRIRVAWWDLSEGGRKAFTREDVLEYLRTTSLFDMSDAQMAGYARGVRFRVAEKHGGGRLLQIGDRVTHRDGRAGRVVSVSVHSALDEGHVERFGWLCTPWCTQERCMHRVTVWPDGADYAVSWFIDSLRAAA